MPRGASDIPELRLERLNKLMTTFQAPPEMVLSNLFPSSREQSSTIKWESQQGNRGLTPFVPPGSPAPRHYPEGVAAHSAEAAFWKEKMYFDEEFVNNLRKEGTESQYLSAQQRLARSLRSMRNRADRRKEWMFAQMLTAGSFTYAEANGTKIDVDYDLDSNHLVTLAANDQWDDGTNRDILEDIMDAKITVSDACDGKLDYGICDSTVLKYMALDDSIQTLLQRSSFGQGDLFNKKGGKIIGVNAPVLGSLLDLNIVIYDAKFVITGILTAAVTGASTVIVYVDNAADFESGETLRFHDVSANTYEDETISSVDEQAGTVTVSTAPATSYKAAEDKVTMTRGFVPNNKFVMISSRVDGQAIAEFKEAPFGNNRNWGMKTDQWVQNDPEGVFIRVQNKGLPILYQRDALYVLTVA